MQTITQHLQLAGWTILSLDRKFAAAGKEYPTACGLKQALAYFWPSHEHPGCFQMSAQYLSEGLNVCSTVSATVDPTKDTAPDLIKQFAKEVDDAVDQSYARRLYLRRK